MNTLTVATLDDLMQFDGKAELIGGRIVELMPTGSYPNEIAGLIYVYLFAYRQLTKKGKAYTDNMGFAVPILPSGRESFSPDASYYMGTVPPQHMRFVDDAPTFAVEVRSENDVGPAAEAAMEDKRTDYFQAGTLVVWDVDPIAKTVTVYRSTSPTTPQIFRAGDIADALPALPNWSLSVDEIFG